MEKNTGFLYRNEVKYMRFDKWAWLSLFIIVFTILMAAFAVCIIYKVVFYVIMELIHLMVLVI